MRNGTTIEKSYHSALYEYCLCYDCSTFGAHHILRLQELHRINKTFQELWMEEKQKSIQRRRVFMNITSLERLNIRLLDNAQLVGNIGSLLVGGQANISLLQAIRSVSTHKKTIEILD